MNHRDVLIAEKQENSNATTDKTSKNQPTRFILVGFLFIRYNCNKIIIWKGGNL